MNFIFHTLKLQNREINAKKNSTVKDATVAVEKRNPEKFGRLAADSNPDLFYISAVCCKVCSHY